MKFEEIVGNDEIKDYLDNTIKQKKILQSYIFSGTEGIGKKIIAKEFAKKILCIDSNQNKDCQCKSCKCFDNSNHPDYFMINNNGDTIKIEQIRDLTNKVSERPIISDKKIYIINDCDKMTTEAQNCLLKTLEEPPEFVTILLISSNENTILNTIKSRCMTIKFKNIPNEKLEKYILNNLNYGKITQNMLKSFNGSIGKAILQKENEEKFIEIEKIIDMLPNENIIDLLNSSKIIYEKENIYDILEYMIICVYSKKDENINYINCIDKINKCIMRLKRNCNFDMTIDKMLIDMKKELA